MYTKSIAADFGNMDLICRESVMLNECTDYVIDHNSHTIDAHHVLTACQDPTFLDERCLENLLKAEDKYAPPVGSYFGTMQTDITPPMRKIVSEWMLEVCEERNCQEEVFLLALNYMDRYLATTNVRKTHLQTLAAACLLMASKLREPSCRGLPAEILVFYTDNSVSKRDLINWELIVLNKLKWDVSSVTPLDFLELLLIRLPLPHPRCPDITPAKVRRHAQAFISLAAREHYFFVYSASTIGASSIAAALSGMKWDLRTGRPISKLLDNLTDLTGVEQEYLSTCMYKMEEVFDNKRRSLDMPFLHESAKFEGLEKGGNSGGGKMISGTPTDVQDIQF